MKLFVTLSLVLVSCGAAPERPEPKSEDMNAERIGLKQQDIALTSISDSSSLLVPTLQLSIPNGSFLKILRCNQNVELQNSLAEPWHKEMSPEDQSLVWNDELKQCKGVGAKVTQELFQDISVPEGTFYYLVNACKFAEYTASNQEGCNNLLQMTDDILVGRGMPEEMVVLASAVSQAEAELAGIYSKLNKSVERLQQVQKTCEANFASSESQKGFWRGIAKVTMTAIGAAVGAAVTGGTGAIAGAQAGLSLAAKLFGEYTPPALECPQAKDLITAGKELTAKEPEVKKKLLEARAKLQEIEKQFPK